MGFNMESNSRKKVIIKISATLVVILLILTFFSNTIYNLNVAGVVVGFESGGLITTTYRSNGVLDFSVEHTVVFAEHTGRIHILISDGDAVRANEPLFEIHTTLERNQILDRIAALQNRQHSLPRVNIRENNEEIRRLQDLLTKEDGDIQYIYTELAPIRGEVHLSLLLENTNQIMTGQAVLSIAVREETHYSFSAYFPETFVFDPGREIRRTIRFNIPILGLTGLRGEMEEIKSEGGRLLVDFTLDVPGASGGERVEVVIEDSITVRDNLLPNAAIREDGRGDFILIVKRESNTLLGHSYYAERINISVFQRGDHVTSFRLNDELDGPVILQSDRPIRDGDRIRVVGER